MDFGRQLTEEVAHSGAGVGIAVALAVGGVCEVAFEEVGAALGGEVGYAEGAVLVAVEVEDDVGHAVEILHIHAVGGFSNVFILGEAEVDVTMFEAFAFAHQLLDERDEDGAASLAVGTEEGAAVGGDDGAADEVFQVASHFGIGGDDDASREDEGSAVVVAVDLRFDALAVGFGGNIEMGHEHDGRDLLFDVGGDFGVDVVVVGEDDLDAFAQGLDFVVDVARYLPLSFGHGE